MNFIKSLTPKNTEEIKPNFFIQKRKSGLYKQVYPLVWNGRLRWKEQLKTVFSFRTLLTLAIIIFLVFSYLNDVKQYKDFYESYSEDPIGFCNEVINYYSQGTNPDGSFDFNKLQNEKRDDTYSLPSYT